jgi:hypothetical protein
MSHYHAEIWIQTDKDVKQQVQAILAPYGENLEVEQKTEDGETWWTNPNGWWDWWQIGGRWKGAHAEGYDPYSDPEQVETCDICGGTGDRPGWVSYAVTLDGITLVSNAPTRSIAERRALVEALRRNADPNEPVEFTRRFADDWSKECNGCNSCHGKGIRTSWPTQWKAHELDVAPIVDVPDTLTAYTVIADSNVLHEEAWNGSTFVDGALKGKTVKQALFELGISDGFLVTVDYHS